MTWGSGPDWWHAAGDPRGCFWCPDLGGFLCRLFVRMKTSKVPVMVPQGDGKIKALKKSVNSKSIERIQFSIEHRSSCMQMSHIFLFFPPLSLGVWGWICKRSDGRCPKKQSRRLWSFLAHQQRLAGLVRTGLFHRLLAIHVALWDSACECKAQHPNCIGV